MAAHHAKKAAKAAAKAEMMTPPAFVAPTITEVNVSMGPARTGKY